MNKFKLLIAVFIFASNHAQGQTILNIYPDSLLLPVNINLTPGVFYVPKTDASAADFMANNIHQNSIRTNVIESALNAAEDLESCLLLLATVQNQLQNLSAKCDKLIFIFEKMPPWLSSSSDGSPAATSGWYVLNTKPPENWITWQTVVDSITSKIVNQFGINNAYFEIWNEPDLGSWTGTMNEYFDLYKFTYDGIKSANLNAKVGGFAVNFWANNIFWQPLYGYISNAKADSSLIGQLLDSSIIWNKVPDFISWHNFNLSHQEFTNAAKYIEQKVAALSLSNIPLIVSEWNAPIEVRDTRLANSFVTKVQLEISKTNISNHAIAAWQDFNASTIEFHNDYGLLTYGAIHKPVYNSILLVEKLNGDAVKMESASPFDGICSIENDTLFVFISNYCPPPFVEAFNETLYQGHLNAKQLDSAGFINIIDNNFLHLDSIYKGLIVIPNNSTIEIAINNAIGTYQHFDSIENSFREFTLKINGYSENYEGQFYTVDSTQNNLQFAYDSLLAVGYTQPSAISEILTDQTIKSSTMMLNDGQFSFSMQPNAVCLFKIKIFESNNILENVIDKNKFIIYPNPTKKSLAIVSTSLQPFDKEMEIYNIQGTLIKTFVINQNYSTVDLSNFSSGIYFIRKKNYANALRFVLE